MTKRIYGSRYIHVCNSGTTISVRAAEEGAEKDRAELVVEMGAYGAIKAELVCRGEDYDGLTSAQLRDIGKMFADAADRLDKNESEVGETPRIVNEQGGERVIVSGYADGPLV